MATDSAGEAVRPAGGWTGPGLAFSMGVGGFHLLTEPLPWGWLLAPAIVLALATWGWGTRHRSLRAATWALLFGVTWAQFHACLTLCHPFPETYTRSDLEVEGRIASLPAELGTARRFLFRVDAARHGGEVIGFAGLTRLAWYDSAPPLSVGERWRLKVRLKPPHGFANPGGFDLERWLFEQAIKATGHVRGGGDNLRLDPGPGVYWVDRLREGLRDHIARQLSGSPALGLVQALTLGERSAMPPAQWEALTRAGISHLVAISGVNVGLVAGFVFFLVRWLWVWRPGWTLALAAPRAAALAGLGGALAYSALAGFAVSTQRALVMLAVLLAALYWGRTPRPFAALTLALALILALDPQAVLSYGFWLSFGAVAVLLFTLGARPLAWAGGSLPGPGPGPGGQDTPPPRADAWFLAGFRAWLYWGAPQWAVAVGLLPALLLLFGRVSLISPAVNLVAVPLFGLLLPVVLVAVLVSLIPGLGLPLVWVAQLLSWFLTLVEALAALPWATETISARPAWVWVAAFAGVVLLLAPRGLPGRGLGLVALLPLVLVRPPAPAPGEAWFTLLDVGQGLAAVVRTQGHTLVYDTGPGFASGFETGSAVVLPYLREVGVGRIDTLVLSHADKDHAGGFAGLNGAIPIGRTLSGEPGGIPEADAAPCRAGDAWDWDGVGFALLHPHPGPLSEGEGGVVRLRRAFHGNDSSCVLRVVAGETALLLTGDVGRGVEGELAARLGDGLRSDILVAGHHGSATSSAARFLAAVAPGYVLYAAGFANRHGFPATEVRRRVAALGAVELNTGALGAVSFRLGPGGLAGPARYRAQHRRLWTHRPPAQAVPESPAFGYD
jgi:competence protein ComEC